METKSKSTPLITYIHEISGQLRRQNIIESEHAYAKFWNRHPDPSNKSRPARFLFMQSFARWSTFERQGDLIDVDSVDEKLFLTSNPVVNPLVAEVAALTKGQVTITEEFAVTDSSPNKSTWSNLAQRIWAKALNILYTDRLIRLSIEGTPNEIITKKMISHKCANKFRHLFASLAFWDPSILSWLHATLLEHVSGQYLIAYHESMQLLRSRFPSIIDRFYLPPIHNDPIRSRNKGPMPDPIQNVLNNHKPKRIKNCPLFILVPNGPQSSNSTSIPQRLKHWQLLFASLGKIITLSINYRSTMRVKDCLNEIMIGVRDKIAECRTTFTEGRPIILVGFGHSSLIATHVALDSTCKVTATICLGFPLAGVNGFRGDLDDPLLDTTVPTLFVIGQNATLSSIDDVEDFRERITKTETGLVVVGGANDHLVVSQTKQRFTGITQAIVDRCISDEIYDFINFVMNPHFVPSENNYVSAAAKNLSKTPPGAKGEKTTKSKSKYKSKAEKQAAKETTTTINNSTGKLGSLSSNLNDSFTNGNKDTQITTQSTVTGNTGIATNAKPSVTSTKPVGLDASVTSIDSSSGTSSTTANASVSASVSTGSITGVGGNRDVDAGLTSVDKIKSSAFGATSVGGSLEGVTTTTSNTTTTMTTSTPKGKSKAKKSRPKPKKKEEPKKMDEGNKLITGKDGKLDKEGKQITPIEESKQSGDLKESKEIKQSKDKKEGDKESKEGKTVKESKTSKEKENKKKDSEPIISMTCEPIPTVSTPIALHHQQPTLPPPLLTAPTLMESTHTNITPSPPPPLITAPVSLVDDVPGLAAAAGGGGLASGNHPATTLSGKRKKTSTSKFDPDGLQPIAKKKREDPVMSISSIEKIEQTLDEVIATSMLQFQSSSPSIESSTNSTTITQQSPQSDKTIFKQETSQQSVSIISTPTTNIPTSTSSPFSSASASASASASSSASPSSSSSSSSSSSLIPSSTSTSTGASPHPVSSSSTITKTPISSISRLGSASSHSKATSSSSSTTSRSTSGSVHPKLSTPIKTSALANNNNLSTTLTPTTTTITSTTKSSTSVNRDYIFSYEVSEVTTLPPSSTNTRTRTIRAPKQLDI